MLSCKHYDILELCCIYNLAIKVQLSTGKLIQGVAINLVNNANNEECIRLQLNAGLNRVTQDIELARIYSIEALVKNPHFDYVSFVDS
ncbi:Rho-binding antiterminator [uncultured Pseudoteredinibacter sp.]|uniref:Rho-binding antiterminator n=1 Tax=uncultured Pseudoteredinibacter sp. TaxID=1641701 RepID=UPI00262AE19C|nr:Rho-binding antiterminator [uncultured Pseudoteredinibacter sp.]